MRSSSIDKDTSCSSRSDILLIQKPCELVNESKNEILEAVANKLCEDSKPNKNVEERQLPNIRNDKVTKIE